MENRCLDRTRVNRGCILGILRRYAKVRLVMHINHFDGHCRFLANAENIIRPYHFGVYDVLVLPPSFPFGGMVCLPLYITVSAYHVGKHVPDILNTHLTYGRPNARRCRSTRDLPFLVWKRNHTGQFFPLLVERRMDDLDGTSATAGHPHTRTSRLFVYHKPERFERRSGTI